MLLVLGALVLAIIAVTVVKKQKENASRSLDFIDGIMRFGSYWNTFCFYMHSSPFCNRRLITPKTLYQL